MNRNLYFFIVIFKFVLIVYIDLYYLIYLKERSLENYFDISKNKNINHIFIIKILIFYKFKYLSLNFVKSKERFYLRYISISLVFSH